MRDGSADLVDVLAGSFDYRWRADLVYGGVVRIPDLPVTGVTLSEDGDARIQQSGSCTVAWSDDLATSLVPRYVNDALAPFGAQLWFSCVVSAGPFEETVTFARFEITDVPNARDEQMRFDWDLLTLGSSVELELKELTAVLDAETFDVPTAPASLASAWAEIGRLSRMPISRDVPDRAITRSVMFKENVLDAIYELADVMLDAVPHVTPYGVLSARPNTWPAPAATLDRYTHIVSVGQKMSNARVYNRVVVRASGGGDASVLAVAQITDGPLRVANADGSRSPYGRRTLYLSSEYVTTPGQALPWARSTLEQVSTVRASVLPVVEVFNPLRERGDVLWIQRLDAWVLGRVVGISRSESNRETQELTVQVSRVVPLYEGSPL